MSNSVTQLKYIKNLIAKDINKIESINELENLLNELQNSHIDIINILERKKYPLEFDELYFDIKNKIKDVEDKIKDYEEQLHSRYINTFLIYDCNLEHAEMSWINNCIGEDIESIEQIVLDFEEEIKNKEELEF